MGLEERHSWTRTTNSTDNDATLAVLAHQVAEQVTVALVELSLARKSAVSDAEFEDAVERAEVALLQVRRPLQRLTTELASTSNKNILSGCR